MKVSDFRCAPPLPAQVRPRGVSGKTVSEKTQRQWERGDHTNDGGLRTNHNAVKIPK
jgi:hypothetical protein